MRVPANVPLGIRQDDPEDIPNAPRKYIKKQIKTQLLAATGNSIDELRFVLTKPFMRLEIPDTPYLDLATPFFADALKSSNYFLVV